MTLKTLHLKNTKQKIFLFKSILSWIFLTKTPLLKNPQNLHKQILIINLNLNLKNFALFAMKTIILPSLDIADSICSKNLNFSQNHLLLPFINLLKHSLTNIITKLRVIVVEVLVIIIKNSLAQTVVQNKEPNTRLIIIPHTTIVTDLAMIKYIENLFHEHIILPLIL